ncbi:MAG TPA: peptidylprolyl isomerase [Acidimicrobiia bacterium]|nr:peptidylprolyl isomerase [Acidimicrobiia bacterium]
MKKLIPLILLGLVVAACGGGATLAATVDGQEVTVGDVESLIDSGGADIAKDQFAQFLGFAIQFLVINKAAEEDYGLTFTDEEVAAEADRIIEEVAAGQAREEFLAERGVTEEFLLRIARQGLLDVELRELLLEDVPEPTSEEIEEARAQAELAGTNACVSHILVESEEEALDVLDRLDAGEDFGEIATEVSTDAGSAANNGILPCGSPSGYVEAFRDVVMTAEVGQIHPDPVETEFGFHVMLVTDRQVPTAEDLPGDEELADGVKDTAVIAALEEWFLAAVAEADVVVEEEFGTWDPDSPTGPTVVPPSETSTSSTVLDPASTSTSVDGAASTTSGG